MDGGISDNLALRVLLNDLLLLDPGTSRFAARLLSLRRILVISVDGQSAPDPNWPRQRVVGGLRQIISAVTGTQIGAYNLETLIAVESAIDDLVGKLRVLRCRQASVIDGAACDDVAGMVLRISLSDYPDAETRERLIAIRTGLTLPRSEVDSLVAAGATMIARDAGTIAAFLDQDPPIPIAARRQ
jgi:hypothetical protein